MEFLLLGTLLGVSLGLSMCAGAGVYRGLEMRAYRKRVCSLIDAESYRAEGTRLLYQAIRTPNRAFERYLREQAFLHFCRADQIENGPYKT